MSNLPSHPTVAIIGAGPYGVSIAAHLRHAGIDFRIFGKPMHRWQSQMPNGMFLKSEGCASSLSDPAGHCTLARFCADQGLPFGERGLPVSLQIFTQYALFFQRKLVPAVEEVMVAKLDKSKYAFELQLANGTSLSADKVILATGMEYSAHIPPELASLQSGLLSHAGDHHDLSCFKGKDVTVVGGGQSAIETAVLLSEMGASVRLLVRKPTLAWNQTPQMTRRSFYARTRYPMANLGEGLELWILCNAPMLFRHLPQRIRLEKVKTVLGPAGAWWLKNRLDGRLQISLGHFIRAAESRGGRAVLQVVRKDGRTVEHTTDHVIAATGYRFDLQRLPFLNRRLKSAVRAEQQQPVLSSSFESSIPGLYFTGLASTNYFGPAMRFIQGADYTARRIARHLAAGHSQNGLPSPYRIAPSLKCKEV